MNPIVRIALPVPLHTLFDYACEGQDVQPGCRVQVPFGRRRLVGVAIATGVAVLTDPHGWLLIGFVAASVWLSGVLFNASYALFSIAITGVVVFLLEGIDRHRVATGEDRLLSTVLGAALALLSYALWPTWGRRPAAEALADLADATHRYVTAVLRSYLNPKSDAASPAALSALSRAVRLARTNSEAALDRSLADPGARRLDSRTTAKVLAALRRISITAHTMRLRRPDDASTLLTSVRFSSRFSGR